MRVTLIRWVSLSNLSKLQLTKGSDVVGSDWDYALPVDLSPQVWYMCPPMITTPEAHPHHAVGLPTPALPSALCPGSELAAGLIETWFE